MKTSAAVIRRRDVIERVQRIVHLWLEGEYAALEQLLSKKIVMHVPHLNRRGNGRAAVLRLLRSLLYRRTVKRYDEGDFSVIITEHRSAACYRYTMEYEMHRQRSLETGIDFLVFEEQDNEWKLVWRSVHTSN